MFQETFGLVLLEAFSAALPVIAFRSGGVPELVDHQRNGLLIAQGDEAALLRSMREMMSAKDIRERLGAEGRRTATQFSWNGTADRLDAIYRTVLTERRFPPGRRSDHLLREQTSHIHRNQETIEDAKLKIR
jgi:glycosyltransferase involved in cell wall biosynthesis